MIPVVLTLIYDKIQDSNISARILMMYRNWTKRMVTQKQYFQWEKGKISLHLFPMGILAKSDDILGPGSVLVAAAAVTWTVQSYRIVLVLISCGR